MILTTQKQNLQNINNGAVATPERLNHIENGIANSADKAEVTAQLQQTEQELEVRIWQIMRHMSMMVTMHHILNGLMWWPNLVFAHKKLVNKDTHGCYT